MCGEYGEDNDRPHYHMCLFNFDFKDKEKWSTGSKSGFDQYISEELNDIWGKGFCTIGEVNYESAAYVARYVYKKMLGCDEKEKEEVYKGRLEEYTNMSRRPGIGAEWYRQFVRDVYPHSYAIMKEKPMKPPKYYDRRFEIEEPELMAEIKEKRRRAVEQEQKCHLLAGMPSKPKDGSRERLEVKETIQLQKAKIFQRRKI